MTLFGALKAILVGLGIGTLVFLILLYALMPEKKYNYVIAFADGSQALYQAHEIKPVNFCSAFYNDRRVTAVVCGSHSVVEKEISVVKPSAEAEVVPVAPEDQGPVGSARQES